MVDRWDKNVPIEKSSYLNTEQLIYFNKRGKTWDNDTLNMLDLFCGAGGFSVGCKWAGFRPVFGIDHFKPAMETWCENHPNAIGCLGDIKKLDTDELKELLHGRGIEKIHLITGGVPCQGFSRANRKHIDHDERNFLFLEYMRVVRAFLPDYIILENVSGMRTTAGGEFEREIKKQMEESGYNVTVKLINAADYGVPQIRQRLVFVGVRKDADLASHYTFPIGDFRYHYRTVRDAISDLPELGNNESSTYYKTEANNDYQKLMRGVSNMQGITKSEYLQNHVAPNHPVETIKKIAKTRQGEPMYPRFKQRIRLNYDKPSPTQLAGGIRPQFQFGHPTQPRGLSIRERARIQSFPDSYKFLGGIVQERVQTGNAVPPLMIYHIAKRIAEDLERRKNSSV